MNDWNYGYHLLTRFVNSPFTDVCHAFLQLTSISADANEAMVVVTERFQEACGLI